MPVAGGTANGKSYLKYNYTHDGELTGTKYRELPKTFHAKPGSKYRLWNRDAVQGSRRVFITEGENDALSLVEAGIPPEQVTSLPAGAWGNTLNDPIEKLSYIVEDLRSAREIYIWTDPDVPGRTARQDLVRALGPARCRHIDSDDASDLLVSGGVGAVEAAIKAATAAPIVGLYRLNDLPEPPPREVWYPGIPEWESKVAFGRGMVSVVTGHPNHGKSVLMMQLVTHMAKTYGIQPAICSFENQPKPDHRRIIRSFFHKKLEKDMSDAEKRDADDFIQQSFYWLVHPRTRGDLRWVLDSAEAANIRGGCRFLQIDPFNRLESGRPARQSEHDYIGGVLDVVGDFAADMNMHVQIIAHPKKMQRMAGENLQAPHLDDISGSKHWDNKVDQGFVIHRPDIWKDGSMQTDCKVIVRKVRFPDLGQPCVLDMNYDLMTGCYESADYKTGPV